jgi:hypothetical protein
VSINNFALAEKVGSRFSNWFSRNIDEGTTRGMQLGFFFERGWGTVIVLYIIDFHTTSHTFIGSAALCVKGIGKFLCNFNSFLSFSTSTSTAFRIKS